MRIKRIHGLIVVAAVLIGVGIVLLPDRLGDDDMLTEEVVATLRAIVDVDTGQIQVSVKEGVVTLSGTLPDPASRRIVIDEVTKTDGVKRVIDQMVVEAPSE